MSMSSDGQSDHDSMTV